MKYYALIFRYCIILFCMITGFILHAQDQIFKKDNTKIEAKVLEVTQTEIKYKLFSSPDGPTVAIAKDEVSAIIYQDGRHEVTDKGPKIAKNAVFLEFLGNGGLYSLNYDRIFFTKKKFSLAGRIGLSYSPKGLIHPRSYLDMNNGSINCIPIQVSALYGGGSNKLELGLGYTPALIVQTNGLLYDFNNFAAINVGYRYQRPGRGFFLKSGLMYVKNFDRYLGFTFPFVNVAWGYSF